MQHLDNEQVEQVLCEVLYTHDIHVFAYIPLTHTCSIKMQEVFNAQKKVAQLEEELDQAATNIKLSSERAEENDKVIVDWELQITALNRRISLLVSEFI